MVSQETLDSMIAYHQQGMHVQEIAARLLLDIATVRGALEAHILQERSKKASDEHFGFLLDQLREGSAQLRGHLESLLADRQFEAYNTAYANWLDTMRLYAEVMREYNGSQEPEPDEQ